MLYKNTNLTLIQENLKKDNIDAYLILTSDPHFNEYIAPFYKEERLFFAPFSGSAGEILITQKETYLFVDGRYYLQGEKEIKDTPIKLVKVGAPNVLPLNEFINSLNIKSLAISYLLLNKDLKDSLTKFNIKLIDKSYRDLNKTYTPISKDKLFKLDDNLNTLTHIEKINNIYKELEKEGCEANFISSLDDIAWILNIRGNDIPNNPVFYSYLYLSKKYGNILFIDKDKIEFNLTNIEIKPYEEAFNFLLAHNDIKTLVDKNKTSMKTISCFNNENLVLGKNPSYLMKAIKMEKEIENTKRIQALDGLALVKFEKYLKEHINDNLTEYELSEKLKEFRLENKECFELSFDSIVAVGKNAAEMHYGPTKTKSDVVNTNNIELLVDSGGQYYGGTTDTTRTFLVGKPVEEYIHDYTLTLKAVINLSTTIFLKGCSGQAIDIKAREIMWKEGLDYKCGTGHGVGYILNVHEGPNGFRYKKVKERDDQEVLQPGMITTIEPGVYKENKYGIRIENNLVCRLFNINKENNDEFYNFETITYVPITLECVDFNMLNNEEIDWINNYHETVYNKLSPLTSDKDLLEFLKDRCKKIIK